MARCRRSAGTLLQPGGKESGKGVAGKCQWGANFPAREWPCPFSGRGHGGPLTAPEARQQVALHCRLPVVTPTQPQCVAAGRSGPGPLAPPASAPGGAHGRHWGAAAHPSPPVRNRGWRRRPPPPTYTQQQACQFFLFLCSGGVMTTLQPLAQVQFRTVFALPAGRAAAFPAHCRICPLLSPHETAGATLPRDTPTHALHSRAAHPAGQQGGTPPPPGGTLAHAQREGEREGPRETQSHARGGSW